MRSAIIAAFAAGAIAVPHHMHKPRALVTDYDIVYVTECVTVTEGASSAAPTGDSKYNNNWHWTSHSKPAQHSTKTVKPETSTIYVAPTSIISSVVSQIPTSVPAPESTIVYSVPASQPAYSAPPAQSSSPPSSSGPNMGSPPDASTDYAGCATWHHNLHRANHSAPALQWDQNLADSAQIVANTCKYQHKMDVNGGGYGQNIAAGQGKNQIDQIITDDFYNGEMSNFDGNYGLSDPTSRGFDGWGHFSQLIWKDTTTFGCAFADCTSTGLEYANGIPPLFTVCNYAAQGNYIIGNQDPSKVSDYATNIAEPLGHPVYTVKKAGQY